jgi:hypothetical protein
MRAQKPQLEATTRKFDEMANSIVALVPRTQRSTIVVRR